jgi:hypothetical protein
VIDEVEGDVLGVIPRFESGGVSACEIQGRQLVGRITAFGVLGNCRHSQDRLWHDMKEWQKDVTWTPEPTSEMNMK